MTQASEHNGGSEAPPGPSFQFSLKTLLVVTTSVAVGLSSLVAAPAVINLIAATCFLMLLPVVLTVVLVYGRGYQRTFCIGAMFPSGRRPRITHHIGPAIHLLLHG